MMSLFIIVIVIQLNFLSALSSYIPDHVNLSIGQCVYWPVYCVEIVILADFIDSLWPFLTHD